MKKTNYQFEYEVHTDIDTLHEVDRNLLIKAREITQTAYAPYSKFHVGAVALLDSGEITFGSNQENGSFPVGICAERVLMSAAAMQFPGKAIVTMAIAYHNYNGKSDVPVSPCGMCRQAIHEFEERTQWPIRLILSGMQGNVIVIEQASMLLPLSFDGDVLK